MYNNITDIVRDDLKETIQRDSKVSLAAARFSGSATTAHAVMQLNAEDGGHRKFIMVQLPELCDEKSEAYKAGYPNICEIGKERIRRAAKKIAVDNPGKFFDGGFRVFKLDDTNMTDVYYSAGECSQDMLSLLESNIKPDRTDLDLLFGCLLEWGLPLSMPYTSEKIDSCTVHTYNDGDLIAYFEIGRIIVEEEQNGKNRAAYGKQILQELSEYLTGHFGKGFSVDNLKLMRRFYVIYANDQIGETVFPQFQNLPATKTGRRFYLSWSHYLKLMRIDNTNERHFYEIEAVKNDWSLSELKRQFNSALYERLALSRDKDKVYALALEGQALETPSDVVKDPYVLEFLGLQELPEYSENEMESRIIDHLQQFLLELGRGFAFVGRQVRFTFDEEHFRVDLVFYNRLLRCFVLFDLKIGELKHQDIGQMQMYVNYYDRKVKLDDENPTIGIILCKDKNNAVVEMTLPKDNSQIFASKYETVLPSKEELQKLLTEHLDGGER